MCAKSSATVMIPTLTSFCKKLVLELLHYERYCYDPNRGIGAVVSEVGNIYKRQSQIFNLSDSDVWLIKRDLLNGSYSFSVLTEMEYPFFPYSLPPLYDSILDLPYQFLSFESIRIKNNIKGAPAAAALRRNLVEEDRDALVGRALGVVLNHELFSSQEQEEGDRRIDFVKQVTEWNYCMGPLAHIDVIDLSGFSDEVDRDFLMDQLVAYLDLDSSVLYLVISFLDMPVFFEESREVLHKHTGFANIAGIGPVLHRFFLEKVILPNLEEGQPELKFACWRGWFLIPAPQSHPPHLRGKDAFECLYYIQDFYTDPHICTILPGGIGVDFDGTTIGLDKEGTVWAYAREREGRDGLDFF